MGSGQFPLDMLRYDCCFPASQNDVATISKTLHRPGNELHTVTLRYVREYKPNGPTDARWESFGWHVSNRMVV